MQRCIIMKHFFDYHTKDDESDKSCGHQIVNHDLVRSIAIDIQDDDHLDATGSILGFPKSDMNRFHETNRLSGSKAIRGTRCMLYEWMSRTGNTDADELGREVQRAKTDKERQRPDFYEEKVSDTMTVADLRKHLAMHYQYELCHIQLAPWDEEAFVSLETLYVNVNLYKENNPFICGSNCHKVKLESIDDVFRKKINGRLPFRIAILAKAGSGKTTLVAKIAYDWTHRTEGSPLQEVPLLFVIVMRRLEKDTSLSEAILSQILGDVDVSVEALQKFIVSHADKCMFVFDGYDEYVGTIASKKQMINNDIVKILCNEKLKQSRTVVTLRFYRGRDFVKAGRHYVKMEIEGFTRQNRADYIGHFFQDDPDQADGLHEFINANPVICELIRVPLFCLMICHLWQQGCLDDVRTQTGLFDQVTQFLWHHSRRKEDEADSDEDPSKLEHLLQSLGCVSFGCLLEDSKKLVFSDEDFQDTPEDLELGRKMGLLSKRSIVAKRLKLGVPVVAKEIQFYHKLAQEHCASKYLASLALEPGQLQSELSNIKEKRGVCTYENLLRFTCGANCQAAAVVFEHIHHQSWVLPPDKNFMSRVVLDFLNECPESTLTDDVVEQVRAIFADGYLCLHAVPPTVVLALNKLPTSLKAEISFVRLQSMELPAFLVGEFCRSLQSFCKLKHLGLRGVQLDESSAVEIVKATRNKENLKGLLFKYCHTVIGGTLERFLQEDGFENEPEGKSIKMTIYHEDETHKTIFCRHTER